MLRRRAYPVHELSDWFQLLVAGGPRPCVELIALSAELGLGGDPHRAKDDLLLDALGHHGPRSNTFSCKAEHAAPGAKHSTTFRPLPEPSRSSASLAPAVGYDLGRGIRSVHPSHRTHCESSMDFHIPPAHRTPWESSSAPSAALVHAHRPRVRTLATDRFGFDVEKHAATLSHLDVFKAGTDVHGLLYPVLSSPLPGYQSEVNKHPITDDQRDDDGGWDATCAASS